jgi:hypothetical protein
MSDEELDRLSAERVMGWFNERERWVTVLASTEGYRDSVLHCFLGGQNLYVAKDKSRKCKKCKYIEQKNRKGKKPL